MLRGGACAECSLASNMEESGKISQKTTNGSRGKERMFGNNSRTEFSESSESTLETLVGGLMAQPAPAQYSRSLRDVVNPSGWGPLASRQQVARHSWLDRFARGVSAGLALLCVPSSVGAT